MIGDIINKISGLGNLPFISRYGGLVRTARKVVQTGDDETAELLFPVSLTTGSNCYETGDFRNLVPNDAEEGICYIEQSSSLDRVDTNPLPARYKIATYRVQLRVVVWVNRPKVGFSPGDPLDIFLGAVLAVLAKPGYVVRRILPADPDIFAPYTYDERMLSRLGYPYDYFAIDVEVTMQLAAHCGVILTPEPLECGHIGYTGYVTHDGYNFYATHDDEVYGLEG